ncbi:hypothetical protein [Sulfurospirillum sp. UCH001]|uniref:hypothetical protein n=1 Tax=Sulfurospirillum sp. UCH001 TaxID=1581011 RepID=UPI0008375707|nr:hypothetical protein [Sulfurospirillum sp. UCH001]
MYNNYLNYNTKETIIEKDTTNDRLEILKVLLFITNYQELSKWVSIVSLGKRFMPFPKYSNQIDREICLFAIQKIIFLALQDIKKRRKNGRDVKLLEAVKNNNYFDIANILASAARTFWLDHGFSYSNKYEGNNYNV